MTRAPPTISVSEGISALHGTVYRLDAVEAGAIRFSYRFSILPRDAGELIREIGKDPCAKPVCVLVRRAHADVANLEVSVSKHQRWKARSIAY